MKLLEKRLQQDLELAQSYQKTINSDLANGMLRSCPMQKLQPQKESSGFFPTKPGKVRRVCDAASKFRGSSLNDHLIADPDLLNSLTGVFMRFREEKIALSADIGAMFNQVAVAKEDQPVLRFLWRDSPDSETEVYQYERHIFGAKCAPTCSNYALLQNARDNQPDFPVAAAAVEWNFYMDDFFKSVESVARALKIYGELVELCKKGKFRLTKWISNEREVIDQVPESERAASVKTIDEHTAMPTERALGVGWDTQQDHFVFKVKKRNPAITRRQVLSLIASLFDPLGFLAPFLVRAKIILQRIWQLGVGWDDCLPHETSLEWQEWEGELNMFAEFSVPRFYRHIEDKPVTIQLHVFGDASELAFCSVVYFRFAYGDGSVKIAFVLAKTRVAPRKQLSIPRLELQAVVLNARLAHVAVKEHDYEVDKVYHWSDSTTVLHWIHGTAKRHPRFIANRLGEILDSTQPNQWRYCPIKSNPADDGSRGLPVSVITPSSRWLSGPDYLHLEEQEWPEDKTIQPTDDEGVEKEEIPEVQWAGKASVKEECTELVELNKYSSYFRSLSVVAYIVRFVHNCSVVATERLAGPLSVQEIEKAKTILIQQA